MRVDDGEHVAAIERLAEPAEESGIAEGAPIEAIDDTDTVPERGHRRGRRGRRRGRGRRRRGRRRRRTSAAGGVESSRRRTGSWRPARSRSRSRASPPRLPASRRRHLLADRRGADPVHPDRLDPVRPRGRAPPHRPVAPDSAAIVAADATGISIDGGTLDPVGPGHLGSSRTTYRMQGAHRGLLIKLRDRRPRRQAPARQLLDPQRSPRHARRHRHPRQGDGDAAAERGRRAARRAPP